MSPKILAVIPLRLQSARIPEKVLAPIGKDALCVHSTRKVLAAFHDMPEVEVIAAVDSEKVAQLLKRKVPQLKVVLTDPELPSGTDRVLSAAQIYSGTSFSKLKGILNVQGDMPFVGRMGLVQVARILLENPGNILSRASIVTLSEPFDRDADKKKGAAILGALREAHKAYMGQAAVKVLKDRENFALYFSRFPIPYSRIELQKPRASKSAKGRSPVETENLFESQLHLGVYGYTPKALVEFCAQSPTVLELSEGLEQLRAMWLGQKIFVLECEDEPRTSFRGIDVSADLAWARANLRKFR